MRTSLLAFAALVPLLVPPAPALAQGAGSTSSTQTTTTTKTTQSTAIPISSETTTRPTYEFSLGYQWLRTGEFCAAFDESDCSDDNPKTFPAGAIIDGVRNFGAFGIVAEVGWSHDNDDGDNPFADSLSTDVVHAALGARFTGRPGRVWPYVQVLGGVAVNRFDGQVNGLSFSDTRTRPMAQAGAGVTFVIGDGWGLFVDGAYRRMFLDEDEDFISGRNDVRAAVGFRMILD